MGRWQYALLAWLLLAPTAAFAQIAATPSPVERGHYLALVGNCSSCHTPAGGAPFAGGVAFQTPYGTLYSTNVTQDNEYGIGQWTLAQFTAALRQGVRPDGAHLYPAFPYTEFTRLSDEDVAALYAYFKTITSVHEASPSNRLHFPYSQRWALGIWNTLFFKPGRFEADPKQSAQWNRGAYLVQGLGHCGECHTPRGFLSSEKGAQALSGAVYRDNVNARVLDWSSVNLTPAPDGLGSWSAQDVADYLKYGYTLKAGVFGAMNEVVGNSTRYLTDADAQAIGSYLKALAPIPRSRGTPLAADQMENAEILYSVNCATCHLPTGVGSGDTGPPLAGSPVVLAASAESLINITLYGGMAPAAPPSDRWAARKWQTMDPFGDKLSDQDVASLLSYIRASFGNHSSAVTPAQVMAQR